MAVFSPDDTYERGAVSAHRQIRAHIRWLRTQDQSIDIYFCSDCRSTETKLSFSENNKGPNIVIMHDHSCPALQDCDRAKTASTHTELEYIAHILPLSSRAQRSSILRDLCRRRRIIWKTAYALANQAAKERRYFTPDEQGRWDILQSSLSFLDKKIEEELS